MLRVRGTLVGGVRCSGVGVGLLVVVGVGVGVGAGVGLGVCVCVGVGVGVGVGLDVGAGVGVGVGVVVPVRWVRVEVQGFWRNSMLQSHKALVYVGSVALAMVEKEHNNENTASYLG